jgi:hypothetical protein
MNAAHLATLKTLEAAERKAWRAKMNGSEADACTLFGQEGVNELAWRAAADACRAFREAHGLLGLTWAQIRRAG